jgi:hypothetical protein
VVGWIVEWWLVLLLGIRIEPGALLNFVIFVLIVALVTVIVSLIRSRR